MAKESKKGGGGKLARSETVTVRLDEKLRYLAELAARKQRRTLSSYIEWVIEQSLDKIVLKSDGDWEATLGNESSSLWDVDEADRLIKLALNYEFLLTHDEQVIWKIVKENGSLWSGSFGSDGYWKWKVESKSVRWESVREHWDNIKAFAKGQKGKEALPEARPYSQKHDTSGIFGAADDIPF